jgi:hypothetical protein
MTVEGTGSVLRVLKEHQHTVKAEFGELRQDIRDDFERVERALADLVPVAVYEADKRYFDAQLRLLHDMRAEDRAKTDRAWQLALTSFVAPIVVGIVVALLVAGLKLGG